MNFVRWDPWHYAKKHNRDYLIVDDIADAIDAGGDGDLDLIRLLTLKAISDNRCEDPMACAWTAVNHKKYV